MIAPARRKVMRNYQSIAMVILMLIVTRPLIGKVARASNGAAQQINGCEGETDTLFVGLSVKLKRAWRRFRPTSSQTLGVSC